MTKLLSLFLLCSLALLAQVYTVPSGTTCNSTINACTIQNLSTTAPTPTPFGYFVGGYGGGNCCAQFAFQEYPGQNAAAGGTYCMGTGAYTQTPRPDLGTTAVEWTLTCDSNEWTNGAGPGEVPSGPYHIVVDLITHWYQQMVIVYRWRKIVTIWAIDSGTITLTPN